ncbi:MAG: single-stranded-DNA-specific exonuclease RecJ [Bacteroidota bacterium]|nr:single-stranded-DNA-specific exonuclease RecJ [Bacteroidota bacterium]MDP4232108.1 single-stranded-DNA-specific exonuclease RecJ [Bacteroidota bacterium]MDP4241184.1 single-stranded-DNA-specific exonuclease RecJ [Bacteroidota bacterium]MDP4286576.1 single-stranded-DNA-specific exonuclease RecJ [Bacteroidota bacterium]
MRYRWRLPDPSGTGEALEHTRELSRSINVPESIASILVARNVRTFETAREYFRPSLERVHDPFLMDDMSRAVTRIIQAIQEGERITIYGDYDVDGTTSTAMLMLFFESIGVYASYHIPDRFTEGYGLSVAGIDRCFSAPETAPSLIITIDCGITSIDAVAYARSRGADIIICDHHEPVRDAGIARLPEAYAILNPIKGSCNYPYKHLCGCGVGFKLIQAISKSLDLGVDSSTQFLDFVAMASSADIVSLQGENRILTSFGLQEINERPRPGIRALIQAAQLKPGKIGTSQVVFGLAPRINAAGRLGDGGRAVKLLMSRTDDEAHHHAAELEFENSNRRRIDEEAFFEACHVVDGMLNRTSDRIIVLHNPGWHAGVIGIVASRLVERYHLPVVLLTTIDGVAKGSARSIPGFDIHSAIKRCEDKVVTFGGHKYAAGVSITIERVAEFRTAINDVASELITAEMLEPEIRADAAIDLGELNPKYFAIIRQFQPYGPDNMRPAFYSKDVEVVGYPRIVGKTTPHLKFQVRPSTVATNGSSATGLAQNLIPFTIGGGAMEAIGFGLGERLRELLGPNGRGRKDLEMIYYLEENEYMGRVTPQLVVKDFR